MYYELKPFHTKQKSFYGKARVTVSYNDDDIYLVLDSYDTQVVMVRIAKGGRPSVRRLWDGYSATTLRHVNELLMQEGFPKLSARAWRAMEAGKFAMCYYPDDVPALEKSIK